MTRLNISVHRNYAKFVAADRGAVRRIRPEIDANRLRKRTLLPSLLLFAAVAAAALLLARLFVAGDVFSLADASRPLRFWR